MAATKDSWKLQISDLRKNGTVLSVERKQIRCSAVQLLPSSSALLFSHRQNPGFIINEMQYTVKIEVAIYQMLFLRLCVHGSTGVGGSLRNINVMDIKVSFYIYIYFQMETCNALSRFIFYDIAHRRLFFGWCLVRGSGVHINEGTGAWHIYHHQ